MRENKKILIIVPVSPYLNAGGAKHGLQFTHFIQKMGGKASIIIPDKNTHNNFSEKNIYFLPYNKKSFFTKFITFVFKLVPKYLMYISKHDIVIIYGRNIIGWKIIILISKFLNKTIIFRSTMIGEDDMESLLNKKYNFFTKYIIKQISIYHAISPAFTKSWIKYFNSKRKYIESFQGVNIGKYHPVSIQIRKDLRKKYHISQNQIVLISIGYLIPRKGYRELFNVLADIPNPFLYLVIGDYNVNKDHYMFHLNKTMNNIYNHGKEMLKEKIRFIGNTKLVQEYLMFSDIFLLNSYQEGIPNVLLEAMATEKCCIVRNIKGLYDTLLYDGKNALLFNNIIQLHNIIINIFNQPDICNDIGKNARITIIKEASFENLYQKLIKPLL